MTPIGQDVSFVIIARNEEDRLCRCLDSITRLDMVDCEVICVNSSSTDGTLDVMMAYKERNPFFVVLSPSECRNAAAARNHGMRVASKSKIFFVDGDIELNAKFVQAALEELKDPKIFAVTGGLDEILYDDATKKPIKGPYVRHNYSQRMKEMSCGGMFIAKTEAARATGDYDERFFRSQDLDYSLRLTAKFTMVALPIQLGVHHTGENRGNAWLFFRKGYILNQGMLARKHCGRPGFWSHWYRSRKIFVWGFIAVSMLLLLAALQLCGITSWAPLAIFTAVLLPFEVAYSIFKKQLLVSTLIYSLLCPYAVLVGFCLEPFIGGSGQRAEKGSEHL